MREEFRPAIEALQKDLTELERKVSETKGHINKMYELAGSTPPYADVGIATQPTVSTIRSDSFYGKVIVTASREYLEMRKAADLGPASPREIYEALKRGGFTFDTKNENNAITGIRNTLRKASSIFHRLPGGEYGLLKWYPKAKAPRDDDEGGAPSEKKPAKRGRGRPRKHPKSKAAADSESAAASDLRKTRPRLLPRPGSSQPPKGKEETHVDHEPDITGSPSTIGKA